MLEALQPQLHDTFRESGAGWGNTLDDDIPFLRIDQVWCDDRMRPTTVTVHRTLHTDHRMLVCDLVLNSK
ncbi:MAG TPA: hypothetical protein VFD66_06765 [Verrucomicrobiae bacterium]|nr:hypothetical protein [Verrucomicrobiae bacterium]